MICRRLKSYINRKRIRKCICIQYFFKIIYFKVQMIKIHITTTILPSPHIFHFFDGKIVVLSSNRFRLLRISSVYRTIVLYLYLIVAYRNIGKNIGCLTSSSSTIGCTISFEQCKIKRIVTFGYIHLYISIMSRTYRRYIQDCILCILQS